MSRTALHRCLQHLPLLLLVVPSFGAVCNQQILSLDPPATAFVVDGTGLATTAASVTLINGCQLTPLYALLYPLNGTAPQAGDPLGIHQHNPANWITIIQQPTPGPDPLFPTLCTFVTSGSTCYIFKFSVAAADESAGETIEYNGALYNRVAFLFLGWGPVGQSPTMGERSYDVVQHQGVPGKTTGSPCDCAGARKAGEPVNIGTGNVYEQAVDYRTAGQNPLTFARFYNSFPLSTNAVSLGLNWRSNYDRSLNLGGSQISVERGDGRILTFSYQGGSWLSDTDVDLKLTQTGAGWTLSDSNDTTEEFGTQVYSALGYPQWLLTSIQARNGYLQTLAYNSSHQLVSVTDSFNRALSFTYLNGLLQSLTTPDGLVLSYSYTSSGVSPGVLDRLTSVSYSTNPATSQTYLYENAGLPFALTGITDEDGNRFATWTYDSLGRGLSSQHAGGADLTTIGYDDTTGNRTVTDPLGEVTVYKFATLQGVPKIIEIDRQATSTTAAATERFTYDSNGYTASATDWNGNLTTYVNDSHGQPTSVTEASGTQLARATTITYHATFHVPTQIVTPGLTTTFTYDASGNVLTKTLTDTTTGSVPYSTSGQTRTWTNTWSNFLLASAKGPRTDVSELSTFTYDSSGALAATTNALAQQTKITAHLPGGLPQTVVDANGVTTQLTYDARQRLLTSATQTSAGTLTTHYAYDGAGNLLTVTLPDGSALTNTYDAAHRLVSVADLFNQHIAYTLDAMGNRTQIIVSDSTATTRRQHLASFDALGRLLQDTGGVGQATKYAYDANGNALSVIDPLNHAAQQVFDALNRLTQLTDPASGVVKTTYDTHDRPLSVTDPDNKTTAYTYDGFGDAIQEASPARGTTIYYYDPAGNLVQRVDARGVIANYTYDVLDRMLATSYPGGSSENVAFRYDETGHGFGIGRLTSITDAVGALSRSYDERGNVLSESRVRSPATLVTSYTYDAANRVASITYPSGTKIVNARDAMGRITGVTAQRQGATQPTTVLSNIAYQPFGPVKSFTYGNGLAETRSFDLDYRLTTLAGSGNQTVQNLAYGYDAADNVRSITDAVSSGNSQTFQYDALDRLTNAAGGYGMLAYTYDANGNRLTETPAAPLSVDGLGSMTTLAYNQAGWLASTSAGAQQITQYGYDAFGQRLAKTGTTTGSILFQYDRGGSLLEESDSQGATKAEYIYLEGRPVAEYSAGRLYFLHDDHLGTPQVATDTTQAVAWVGNYEPFGALNTVSSQTAVLGQDLRFPGQENDLETGLYHNGFREYVPGWGRYSQGDPIGLASGPNVYAYVGGNSIGRADQFGLANWVDYLPTGILFTAGGTVEGGTNVSFAGAATAYSGVGIFGGNGAGLNAGAFTASTSFIGRPQCDQFVLGAAGGLGVGVAVTNAGNAEALLGPFDTWTLTTPAGSFQFAISGKIWTFGVGAGRGTDTWSFSRYSVTTTSASTRGFYDVVTAPQDWFPK